MSSSSPFDFLRLLALLAILSCISSCGGDPSDAVDQSSQTAIQTDAIPSDSLNNAIVITGTDANGTEIQIIVESTAADDVTIFEGKDLGLPADFLLITNGFIEIVVPPNAQGEHVVRVMSSAVFEVIVILDEANAAMSYTPYITQPDGAIDFYAVPINGSITFALLDVPEF